MILNVLEFFALFAALHGIILSLVLSLSKRFDNRGKIFLSLLILIISILVLRDLLEKKDIIQHFNVAYIYTWGLPILLGPFIFIYVRAVSNPDIVVKPSSWHFLMPLLYFSFLTYGLIARVTTDEAIANHPVVFVVYMFFQFFIVVQLPYYLIQSMKLVRQYQKRLKDEYSNIDKISLNWLHYLLSAFAFFYAVWILLSAGDLLIIKNYMPDFSVNLVTLLLAIFIYSIGYYTLLRPELFQVKLQRRSEVMSVPLDIAELEEHKSKIIHIIENKKIHLNQKLTVKDLAKELGITAKATSRMINSGFGKSFYDLINSYRIEEVKRNLVDGQNQHLTIEGIALNSGFNSSSTFNRLFKSQTGQTPKAFRSAEQLAS